MAKRDVKNKPSHSDRTLLIAPLFFPSTAFAQTNHKHRHRDELNALPDTSQLPTIPPPGQPKERGVGAPKRGSSSRHYTGGVLAAILTPVFAGQEVISEEARVQVREQVRAHRRTGGVSEPSRAEPSGAASVSQSVSHGDVITAKAN